MPPPRALVAAPGSPRRPVALVASLLLASCGSRGCGASTSSPAASASASASGLASSPAPLVASAPPAPSALPAASNPFAKLLAPPAVDLASQHPPGTVLVAARLSASGPIGGEITHDSRELYLEGHGSLVEGVFDDQRGFFRRVEGPLGDDGSITLREAGDAAGAVVLRGRLQDGLLTGTYAVSAANIATKFATVVAELPFRADPVDKLPGLPTHEASFAGMVADRPVMVRLDGGKGSLRGQLLLGDGTTHALDGSLDEARRRFVLRELDGDRVVGQLTGVASSSSGLTGRYEPSPGSTARGGYFAVRQSVGRFPAPLVVSPGVTLRPRFSLFFGRSCVLERVVPVLGGEPGTGLASLNAAMAAFFTGLPGEQDGVVCDERAIGPATSRLFVDAQDYRPSPLAPGLFALTVGAYQDTNGAHGNAVSRCFVADLATGRLVELRTLIDGERGREGLTRLVEAAFRREMKVTDLTKAGFFSNATPVRETTNLCVEEGKLEVLFEPYEVGPYSFGRPSADLAPAAVKGLLTADPLAAAVLAALGPMLSREPSDHPRPAPSRRAPPRPLVSNLLHPHRGRLAGLPPARRRPSSAPRASGLWQNGMGHRREGEQGNVQVIRMKNRSPFSFPAGNPATVEVQRTTRPIHLRRLDPMRTSFLASFSLLLALCTAACSSSSDDTSTPVESGGTGGTGGSGGSGGTNSGGTSAGGAGGSTAGSGGQAAGAAGGTSADGDKACTDQVKARCARTDACAKDGVALKYGSEAACEEREKIGCLAGLAAPDTSSTPTYVEGCAASITAQSCGDFLNGDAACVPAPGPRKNGDPCGAAAQCDSTFCAVVKNTQCGTCAPLPKAGDSCATIGCGRDLKCDSTSMVCYAPGAAGAACSKDAPCGNALSCVGAKGTGTCMAEITQAGAACDFKKATAADCDRDAGLFCDNNNVCAVLTEGKIGDACGFDKTTNTSTICSAGAFCLAPMMGAAKVCTAAAADGAACDSATGPYCQTPARCIATAPGSTAGTCQLPELTACK